MNLKKKTWEIEIGDRDTLIPFEFYTIKMPSLNGAKREAKKLVNELPAIEDALKAGIIRWDTPSDYRDASIPVADRIVRGTVGNVYIHITLLEVEPDHLLDGTEQSTAERLKIRVALAAVAAVVILIAAYSYHYSTKSDYLRDAMMSTYPDYGKRVLKIYNASTRSVTYAKLDKIVEDFNREVLKMERTYAIPRDYDNMIRTITQNQYAFQLGFLYKTPQHPTYERDRQRREEVSRKYPLPYKEEGPWFEFLQQRREGETQ